MGIDSVLSQELADLVVISGENEDVPVLFQAREETHLSLDGGFPNDALQFFEGEAITVAFPFQNVGISCRKTVGLEITLEGADDDLSNSPLSLTPPFQASLVAGELKELERHQGRR